MSEVLTVNDVDRPVWGAARPSLLAIRVDSGETPEWIADRTGALLNSLQSDYAVTGWNVSVGDEWAELPDSLTDFVLANVVRGIDGEPEPESGYSFSISGTGPRIAPLVRISAGSVAVGRRLPARRLAVQLREMHQGALTANDADAVCAAVAQTWNPATSEFADLAVRQLARRGNWKIGVGYRTWISTEVGKITHLVDRLTAVELAGGTMISAPDDWPAARVVEAMTATLRENGLDEVPH